MKCWMLQICFEVCFPSLKTMILGKRCDDIDGVQMYPAFLGTGRV